MSLNKIYGCGIFLCVCFTLCYLFFFHYFVDKEETIEEPLTVYYVQVGIYDDVQTAKTIQNDLSELAVHVVPMKELYYLVSDFVTEKNSAESIAELMQQKGYQTMVKTKTLQDKNLISSFRSGDQTKLLQEFFH